MGRNAGQDEKTFIASNDRSSGFAPGLPFDRPAFLKHFRAQQPSRRQPPRQCFQEPWHKLLPLGGLRLLVPCPKTRRGHQPSLDEEGRRLVRNRYAPLRSLQSPANPIKSADEGRFGRLVGIWRQVWRDGGLGDFRLRALHPSRGGVQCERQIARQEHLGLDLHGAAHWACRRRGLTRPVGRSPETGALARPAPTHRRPSPGRARFLAPEAVAPVRPGPRIQARCDVRPHRSRCQQKLTSRFRARSPSSIRMGRSPPTARAWSAAAPPGPPVRDRHSSAPWSPGSAARRRLAPGLRRAEAASPRRA